MAASNDLKWDSKVRPKNSVNDYCANKRTNLAFFLYFFFLETINRRIPVRDEREKGKANNHFSIFFLFSF